MSHSTTQYTLASVVFPLRWLPGCVAATPQPLEPLAPLWTTHAHTYIHTHHTHTRARAHTHSLIYHPLWGGPVSSRPQPALPGASYGQRGSYTAGPLHLAPLWTPAATLQALRIFGYVCTSNTQSRMHTRTHTHRHCLTCSHVPALARLLIAEQPVNCTPAWLGEDLRAVHTTSRAPSSYRVTRLESVHHHHGNSRGQESNVSVTICRECLQHRVTVNCMLNLWQIFPTFYKSWWRVPPVFRNWMRHLC